MDVASGLLTAFGLAAAREMVRDRRGRWFDPDLSDAFLAIRDGDGIWRELDAALEPTAIAHLDPGGPIRTASDGDLDRIGIDIDGADRREPEATRRDGEDSRAAPHVEDGPS